jgi:RsiW-degrading membrane proteinase PrsW (M82 family)
MRFIERIKYSIPMIFAILFILIFVTFGVLSIIGSKPFKRKSNELGIGLICVGLFLGFYPGMLFGTLILYLINKYISEPDSRPQIIEL